MRSAESGSLQVGLVEERSLQVGLVQISVLQVGLVEVRLLQVRLPQICSREQNCCGSVLFFSGLIPLCTGEAAAQTRQWKGMQVFITQIRTPQVQPLVILLLLVVARSGTTPVLAFCQEPLDIGTTQFHPLERIDASCDVRDRRKNEDQLFL